MFKVLGNETQVVKVVGGPRFGQGLYYALPLNLAKSIHIGAWVWVPLGQKYYAGIVSELITQPVELKKLKAIEAILTDRPVITESLLSFWQWLTAYYHFPYSKVLTTVIPKVWFTRADLNPKRPSKTKLISEINELDTAGFKQKLFPLSEEQKTVADQFSLEKFSVNVLMGVTGSGKTEIYLHAIDRILQRGSQALLLVPEIGLTSPLLKAIESRLTPSVVVFHSQMTDLVRARQALKVAKGEIKLVIGTRSAVFLPMSKLGIIVIDEEHDASYKQQSGLRYHGRDAAIKRAQLENIPIILGSATPSLETYHNAQQKRFKLFKLNTQFHESAEREVFIIDLRRQHIQSGLSHALLEEIKITLENQQQVMLFLNRRGFSPVLMCHLCGWGAKCQACDRPFTVHFSPPRLVCHHCLQQTSLPQQCPSCESEELIYPGVGTEKLEHLLKTRFPEKIIIRIDRSSTQRKEALNEQLEKVHSGEADILIGTQMIAKGHHFKQLGLVGIIDMDAGLYSADFRAHERTAQLMLQICGRVGREQPGKVFIQTHQPEHPLLQMTLAEAYEKVAEHLLSQRQLAQLPPFYAFAQVRVEAHSLETALELLTTLKATLKPSLLTFREKGIEVEILGPVPALMAKKANFYRAHMLISSTHRKALHQVVLVSEQFFPKKQTKKLRWIIDVDPLEVL